MPGDARSQDDTQLRLLSIFHYVVAGLGALFSLFPAIYVGIGIMILNEPIPDPPRTAPPPFMGWFFIAIGSAAILFGLTFSALLAVAGRLLARRRRWTFCLVIACIACMFMPFGTVLGVFTIVILQRDSVRTAFAARAAGE